MKGFEKRQLAGALDNKSYFLFRKGDLDGAVKANQQAIVTDSSYANSFYNKAIYLIKKGKENVQYSLSFLKHAIELDPECIKEARQDKDFSLVKDDPTFLSITKQ